MLTRARISIPFGGHVAPASLDKSPVLAMAFGLALIMSARASAFAGEAPLPPPRPAEFGQPDTAAPGTSSPAPSDSLGSTCLAKLTADGATAEAASPPAASAVGCGVDVPVRLSSIQAGSEVVCLPDRPLLACEFAIVLADYVRLLVAPLARAMLNVRVATIETGPGYECRTRDRIAGAKTSAHAKGLAVDVLALTFADKRRLVVERQSDADEASYFRVLRTAACGWFTTVPGPGADASHANNMHLDVERHGSSENYRICE